MALKIGLADLIEAELEGEEHLISCAGLARSEDFRQALELYLGRDDFDLVREVTALCGPDSLHYLAAWRYSESGLRIRADWEATWQLQRREDAGEDIKDIPVPPKFGQKDFAQASYWSLRGKLDVPKERFISYPGCQRESDPSPVVGWAGWNHLQRATALTELLPWLKQWHNEVDPSSGEGMGDYFQDFLSEQLSELGLTPPELQQWRPAVVKGSRKGKKKLQRCADTRVILLSHSRFKFWGQPVN